MGRTKRIVTEPLTMAQTLQALLNAPDKGDETQTTRDALCASMIERARGGDVRALQWIYEVAGEERRETKRRNKECGLFSM